MNNNEKFYNFCKIGKKAGYLVEGYNKVESSIKANKIFLVFISKDLSMNSKKKFKNYSLKYGFTLIEDAPLEEIGVSIGKNDIKVLGVKDNSFSRNLKSLYNKD